MKLPEDDIRLDPALQNPAPAPGLLEVLLPLWHRRGWLLLWALAGALSGFGLSLLSPVRYTAATTFVVQPQQRPSQAVVGAALPALAGLVGGGASPIDLHVAILRSQAVADRVIDRFALQRAWALPNEWAVRGRLAERLDVIVGRREGIVSVLVEDESPQKAAAMANEFVAELRAMLRTFAGDEARQRRAFYEQQLAGARQALEKAQRQLQGSGFDAAALRVEPKAAADSYARLRAEVAAAEVRLATTRRVRSEQSAEVEQQVSELAALRSQLAALEAPREGGKGEFVPRVREFRAAELLVETYTRQLEAARIDEASDAGPLQVLDKALVPLVPSRPRPLLWIAFGLLAGLFGAAAVVTLRCRMALARMDPEYGWRTERIRAALGRPRTTP